MRDWLWRETGAGNAEGRDGEVLRGHVSRNRKLLEQQKAGEKKMRQFGKVEIPREAFIAALKMDGRYKPIWS